MESEVPLSSREAESIAEAELIAASALQQSSEATNSVSQILAAKARLENTSQESSSMENEVVLSANSTDGANESDQITVDKANTAEHIVTSMSEDIAETSITAEKGERSDFVKDDTQVDVVDTSTEAHVEECIELKKEVEVKVEVVPIEAPETASTGPEAGVIRDTEKAIEEVESSIVETDLTREGDEIQQIEVDTSTEAHVEECIEIKKHVEVTVEEIPVVAPESIEAGPEAEVGTGSTGEEDILEETKEAIEDVESSIEETSPAEKGDVIEDTEKIESAVEEGDEIHQIDAVGASTETQVEEYIETKKEVQGTEEVVPIEASETGTEAGVIEGTEEFIEEVESMVETGSTGEGGNIHLEMKSMEEPKSIEVVSQTIDAQMSEEAVEVREEDVQESGEVEEKVSIEKESGSELIGIDTPGDKTTSVEGAGNTSEEKQIKETTPLPLVDHNIKTTSEEYLESETIEVTESGIKEGGTSLVATESTLETEEAPAVVTEALEVKPKVEVITSLEEATESSIVGAEPAEIKKEIEVTDEAEAGTMQAELISQANASEPESDETTEATQNLELEGKKEVHAEIEKNSEIIEDTIVEESVAVVDCDNIEVKEVGSKEGKASLTLENANNEGSTLDVSNNLKKESDNSVGRDKNFFSRSIGKITAQEEAEAARLAAKKAAEEKMTAQVEAAKAKAEADIARKMAEEAELAIRASIKKAKEEEEKAIKLAEEELKHIYAVNAQVTNEVWNKDGAGIKPISNLRETVQLEKALEEKKKSEKTPLVTEELSVIQTEEPLQILTTVEREATTTTEQTEDTETKKEFPQILVPPQLKEENNVASAPPSSIPEKSLNEDNNLAKKDIENETQTAASSSCGGCIIC